MRYANPGRALSIGKVLIKMGKNSRTVAAGLAAARVTAKSAARTTHVLWLEVTGFFFSVFTVIGGAATYRALLRSGWQVNSTVVIGMSFSLIFAYFAGSSFARARQRARQR